MAMERWDPFRDMVSLRDAMDRLIQDSFVRPAGSLWQGARGGMPLDVMEKDNGYEVHASLPGIKPEDVQITVQGNTVTIRGEGGSEQERKDQNWIVRERRSGAYYRSFSLPSEVDASKVTARYENGVLTMELPKAEAAQPRRIPVNAGAQPAQATNVSVQSSGDGQTRQTNGPATGQSGDQVTGASQESFPASDAPSWTPERS
jgi:HSP20 family protein